MSSARRRRPRRSVQSVLVVVALAVVAAGWLATQRDSAGPALQDPAEPTAIIVSEPAPTIRRPAARPLWPADVRRQNPEERDPVRRARLARELAGWRAYQALPFAGDGILVEIAEARADGRVVLRVSHSGTRLQAWAAYRRFLSLHRDSGRHYAPSYLALPDRPPAPSERRPTEEVP